MDDNCGGGGGGGSTSPGVSFSGYDFSDTRDSSRDPVGHPYPSYQTQTSGHSQSDITIPGCYVSQTSSQSQGYHSFHGNDTLKGQGHDTFPGNEPWSRRGPGGFLGNDMWNGELGFDNDDDRLGDGSSVGLTHGFSLGKTCTVLTKTSSVDKVNIDEDEEEEEEEEGEDYEDEGISEVYGQVLSETLLRAPTPIKGNRHVISRIDRVGHIAQNLALGHRVGILADDTELTPHPIQPEPLQLLLDDDSPLQADITWSSPSNAHNFKKLTYECELQTTPSESWQLVASTSQAVFRVYHTDDVMLIGKHRLCRQDDDLAIKLRVRARGEISNRELMVASEWSDEVLILFIGYQTHRDKVQITSL